MSAQYIIHSPMTVGELRKYLEDVSDDIEVHLVGVYGAEGSLEAVSHEDKFQTSGSGTEAIKRVVLATDLYTG